MKIYRHACLEMAWCLTDDVLYTNINFPKQNYFLHDLSKCLLLIWFRLWWKWVNILSELKSACINYFFRTARVCRRWYDLSYHPSLWTVVDLSIGWIKRDTVGLHMLCETRLHKTVSLDLTAWFGMSDQCLEVSFTDFKTWIIILIRFMVT
jgi:hypothetical protein